MTGMEHPDAADLLEIARTTLAAEVIPHLAGDARFKALMVANAMAIAARAARLGDIADLSDPVTICQDIRAGRHDGDADLGRRLLDHAEARCRISSKPAS